MCIYQGFSGSSADKESPCNVGDPGLIPGLRSPPGEGIDYPLLYSWTSLMAQMVKDREAWCATVHGVCKESDTTEQLNLREMFNRECMYIFEINPLSVASFAIIFSQSEGCFFTLLIVSFVVQKLLIRSHLCIFAFISNILGGGS